MRDGPQPKSSYRSEKQPQRRGPLTLHQQHQQLVAYSLSAIKPLNRAKSVQIIPMLKQEDCVVLRKLAGRNTVRLRKRRLCAFNLSVLNAYKRTGYDHKGVRLCILPLRREVCGICLLRLLVGSCNIWDSTRRKSGSTPNSVN